MVDIKKTLSGWPVGTFGNPILRSTEDSLLYAQLIWYLDDQQDLIITLRNKLRKSFDILINAKVLDYNRLSAMACLSQFYRECLEECKRIQEDHK